MTSGRKAPILQRRHERGRTVDCSNGINHGQHVAPWESMEVIARVLSDACNAERELPLAPSQYATPSGKAIWRNRIERHWIGLLHQAFTNHFEEPRFLVFSRFQPQSGWLGRSEFLHDVAVFELRERPAKGPRTRKGIPVLKRTIWQVESETAKSDIEVAIDFNKLTAGSAENKLILVRQPRTGERTTINQVCDYVLDMSEHCAGNLFLAFIPGYGRRDAQLRDYWMQPGQPLPFDIHVRVRAASGWRLKPFLMSNFWKGKDRPRYVA